jgi:hypothetical protein
MLVCLAVGTAVGIVNGLLLTVRGSYRRQEYGGQPVTDARIYGQADIAF